MPDLAPTSAPHQSPPESIDHPFVPVENRTRGLFPRSAEENAILAQKATLVRQQRAAKSRTCSCRERLDLDAWRMLASLAGVYWPPCGRDNDRAYVLRVLKALGRSPAWYRAWTGAKTIEPQGSCPRQTLGLLLEAHDRNLHWDDVDWPILPQYVPAVSLKRGGRHATATA